MVQRWEEEDASLEASRLLEDQKRTALPLMKAQKASIAIRWVLQTAMDRKPILEEAGLPWREDIQEQVEVLETYIKKNHAQYENNMLQLKATQEQQNQESANTFTIEDAIATLNLAGFTIADPNKLTIGQFKAMNRAIQKNGKRAA